MTSHAVEDVKQGQHFCIAGESSNVYNYSRNQFGSFLENKEYFYLKIQLYHSQAYTQEMFHHTTRNFFTIFLAALFITDKFKTTQMSLNWKMDKENLVHLHNGIPLSYEKKGIMKYAGQWMELENIFVSEATQTQKDNHGMC